LLSNATIGPWSSDDPRLRTLLAHLGAIAAALVILAIQGPSPLNSGEVLIGLVIGLGFTLLRVMSVRKRLTVSTIGLDALGMVVFLAGTGAPTSPFYFLAISGVWWAAHLPRPRSGLLYGLSFAIAYAVFVLPAAIQHRMLVEAFEDATVLVMVAALSDWFVRVDQRTIALSDALSQSALNGQTLAVRQGIERLLGTIDMPVDVVLAAAQVGLSVVQAELLAFLVMGLTNREIAEAASVSEATVRYRLTGLYRTLGVHGRRDAVRKALALGLSLPAMPVSDRAPGKRRPGARLHHTAR
jgi:DNA-binding CsgD family transcriptional regulator